MSEPIREFMSDPTVREWDSIKEYEVYLHGSLLDVMLASAYSFNYKLNGPVKEWLDENNIKYYIACKAGVFSIYFTNQEDMVSFLLYTG
jgi:hypothetical protein